ncbi:uncharacterized protein LOC108604805 isoform X1 [Drosophila busckii]|uniref:uncharacterized protein LOC108604805 isoform X1 n=1 Tax=Drosophila busckii TaxID=30019 RepID=UPI00083ED57A|nr:uncharacterized protein LOC108604805 isoform X1 [Drosophila busckii]
MDADTDDDIPSSSAHSMQLREIRKTLLEVAASRPGTNVSKAIVAFHEHGTLSNLIVLLEELSKNTDFSTDTRISLNYYMDEFVRLAHDARVSRRSSLAAAGNVFQYCSKIYGDRIEFVHQVVEQLVESLIMSDPKKDETNAANAAREAQPAVEAPRKRRSKKLAQKEFDPFTYQMEVKKFKTMHDEKRFNQLGFELNLNRNRTVEHMYQDHTPADLWKYAPIIDSDNPSEVDEKKNYKLFTYHPEPRYNTLLPDIPFERLNLMKEFMQAKQLNENLSHTESLDEYIALENQMLAERYGAKDCAGLKRVLDKMDTSELLKRMRLNEDLSENLLKRTLEESASEKDVNKKIRLNSSHSVHDESQDDWTINIISGTTLTTSPLQTGFDSTLSDKQDTLGKTIDSDIDMMNASDTLQDTQMESALCSTLSDKQDTAALVIDSGIDMEDVSEMLHSGQCFDDEGVVLADTLNDQRLQSLSPKVMVRDILPGVPDKANLSVRVDAEMLALSGLTETFEEIVHAPRDVQVPITLNFLQLPIKQLRKVYLFRLTKDFDLFKQARQPTKQAATPKVARVKPTPLRAESPLEGISLLPLDQMEFDSYQNFRGWRRPTYDSGIDQEEIRADSTNPLGEDDIIDVGVEFVKHEIQQARVLESTNISTSLDEIDTSAAAIDKTGLESSALDVIDTTDITLDLPLEDDAPEPSVSDLNQSNLSLPATPDFDLDSTPAITKSSSGLDANTEAKIIDWHRRLGPTLAAAHKRQNFNIQSLNDEIIEKCQIGNGQTTLSDVMEGKEPSKLCCYMLSSLLLTNQGNVALQLDKHRDRSRPTEPEDLKMKLLSTERRTLNPEDDIGNVNRSPFNGATNLQTVDNTRRRKLESITPIKVKSVRLIQPVPTSYPRADDTDSGISSVASAP